MHANTIGYAKIIKARTATFPSRMAHYFDFSEFGGSRVKLGAGPGAIVLRADGTLADLQTGRVYYDPRFDGRIEVQS